MHIWMQLISFCKRVKRKNIKRKEQGILINNKSHIQFPFFRGVQEWWGVVILMHCIKLFKPD